MNPTLGKHIDELDITLKDHKGGNKLCSIPKDCGRQDEPGIFLKYCEAGDKHHVFLNQDESSEKHDVSLNDHKLVDKEEAYGLLRDLEGENKSDLHLKAHESTEEHSAITCIPPKAKKVERKKKWEKRSTTDSATLFQAYLSMISKKGKKRKYTNENLSTGEKIQPFNLAKSSTDSEHGGTLITKTDQPIAPQKKSNEEQFAKRFFKKQSHQKKAALERDLLAESSEAFLPILSTTGCSKELQKCFDSQGKLDRSEFSSFNEINKSKDITLHASPNSKEPLEYSLKRSIDHTIPSDFKISKKKTIDPHPSTNVSSRLDCQVVIMKDYQGSPMRKVDLDEVLHFLNAEVMRFILENDNPCFIPRFFGFRVDQNHMWFILKCKDRDTMKWVLNLNSLNTPQSFNIVKFEKAPWRSIKICFTVTKNKPEVRRVVRLLASQNRMLNVASWRHIKITGCRGEWTFYFLLTVDESKQLDEVGWIIFFELGMLQVLKL